MRCRHLWAPYSFAAKSGKKKCFVKEGSLQRCLQLGRAEVLGVPNRGNTLLLYANSGEEEGLGFCWLYSEEFDPLPAGTALLIALCSLLSPLQVGLALLVLLVWQ